MWSGKFKASARVRGFYNVLQGVETPPPDSESITGTTDADKEKLRLRKANIMGYNALIQSMVSASTFQKIENATSADHPDGDARLAWESLKKKYEPDSIGLATNLEKEFTDTIIKSVDVDPEDYIEELITKKELRSFVGKAQSIAGVFAYLETLPRHDIRSNSCRAPWRHSSSTELCVEKPGGSATQLAAKNSDWESRCTHQNLRLPDPLQSRACCHDRH